MVDDNSWPPEKPEPFTPLLLIHRQGGYCTPGQVTALAELTYTGDIGKAASVMDQSTDKLASHKNSYKMLDSKATKEITESYPR